MAKNTDEILKLSDNGMGQRGVQLYKEDVDSAKMQRAEFVVRNDDTDHIAFFCPRCKKEANIESLAYYRDTVKPTNPTQTLYFDLYCDQCGKKGQKKMYPNLKLGDVSWH